MKIRVKRRVPRTAPPSHSHGASVSATAVLDAIPPQDVPKVVDRLERSVAINEIKAAIPPKFKPFLRPSRYKGAFGGRASMKSWTFAELLTLRCLEIEGTRWACIREVQKTLAQSVKRTLEDTIKRFDVGRRFDITNNEIRTPGDGLIIFQGMQDHTAESIKSLEGFDGAYVEEAQSLSERSLTLLRPTIRKKGSEMWFSWNPRFANDPVDLMFRGVGKGVLPNALSVEVSYHDNPWLSDELKAEIAFDQARDPDKYQHIWLGGYEKNSEARVFKNWTVDEFETPDDAPFLFGGDWGFSVDPTVLVRMWIDGRKLFIDREVYKVGCEIDHTPTLFDQIDPTRPGMARGWEIVTDSARPETISYMQRHGYPRTVGAKKGPDSVKEGIEFLKTYDIVVHRRCVHVVDEFTMYSFKTHPQTGEVMPILEDKKNHVIDSCRYAVEKLRMPKKPIAEVW